MTMLEEVEGNSGGAPTKREDALYKLRSYQAEMVEESLKSNIIVAMDTGSGKTQIALARTAAELETCDPNKLVWFLAPSVTLCEQQLRVFRSQLPQYGIEMLCGNDGVDRWTDQATWDAVLKNIHVVISTHQVLLDALSHAFVTMKRLALLIFDEAHHCVENHPAYQIMAKFYMPALQTHGMSHLPAILGLSASPVMKAKAGTNDLQIIEANLNSVAKTPKIYRSELLRHVHPPMLQKITYKIRLNPEHPEYISALEDMYSNYDMKSDPWVLSLLEQRRQGCNVVKNLETAILKRNTFCYEQLKSVYTRSKATFEELGPYPTEWYLRQIVDRYDRMMQKQDQDQLLFSWTVKERQHLAGLLGRLRIPTFDGHSPENWTRLSPKLDSLIDVLASEACPEFTGLVFVEQRAWAAILGDLLSSHPRLKGLFNIGTFVGTSNLNKSKKNIGDLAEPRNQQGTLDNFRAGKVNLIIATNVLEEGIDVLSCNLVICFEKPKNLKSFIQRRGRARKQESKYIIFMDEGDVNAKSPKAWEAMEEQMKAAYLDDFRKAKEAEARESIVEKGDFFYRVPSTGALLATDNALGHLYHFCSVATSEGNADKRPQFDFDPDENGFITAEVTLPLTVAPSVRKAVSARRWATERMAQIDAAFQAYKALHAAGLVNDNLLPNVEDQKELDAEYQKSDDRPASIKVSPSYNPWIRIAEQQQQHPYVYTRSLLEVKALDEHPISMVLFTPSVMPEVPEFTLYWNATKTFSVKISRLQDEPLSNHDVRRLQSITYRILRSVYHGEHLSTNKPDLLWLLAPPNVRDFERWDMNLKGTTSATGLLAKNVQSIEQWGLVNIRNDARKFMVQSVVANTATATGVQLAVSRFPKRRDFLHPIRKGEPESKAYTGTLLLNPDECEVSCVPAAYSVFAVLLPSILSKLETFMVTDTLRRTILSPLAFGLSHVSLLTRAMTSSVTGEADYQRLEFLGDCILKYITSIHLMAPNPLWFEKILTGKKGKLVCNGYLARATMSTGLDKFIFTKRFGGKSWKPHYSSDIIASAKAEPEEKYLSSKILADVIESLIGASFTVGGFPGAFTCIQTLLGGQESWTPLPEAVDALHDAAPNDFPPSNLSLLEEIVGYTFNKKLLLLEALTHVSFRGPHVSSSYERLEFLGDAVLDYIVSIRLYNHGSELKQEKMHGIRTAMVNAAFLSFCMFETTVMEEIIDKTTFEVKKVPRDVSQFLRLDYPVMEQREKARVQHMLNRDAITHALYMDARYPWHLLARNDAPKFLSDIVESILGAIFIDSRGSMAACEAFVRKLGILDLLEKILGRGVDCLHPKERLGILAGDRKVRYVPLPMVSQSGGVEPNSQGLGHRCQVEVGGKEVGGPVQGIKKLNAETIAAWLACGIMENEGQGREKEVEKQGQERDGDVEMADSGGSDVGVRLDGNENDKEKKEEEQDKDEEEGGVEVDLDDSMDTAASEDWHDADEYAS